MKNTFLPFAIMALVMIASVQGQYASCTDWAADSGVTFTEAEAQVIESAHNYCESLDITQHYSWTNSAVVALEIVFDSQTYIESYYDSLTFSYTDISGEAQTMSFSGSSFSSFILEASEFDITFHSDSSVDYWGYSFTATPTALPCSDFSQDQGATYTTTDVQTIESAHDYCDNLDISQHYSFTDPNVTSVLITFDSQSEIESGWDVLTLSYVDSTGYTVSETFTGSYFSQYIIYASEFDLTFTSDSSVTYWGYKFTANPSPCAVFEASEGNTFQGTESHTIQSPHPYCDNLNVTQHYQFESYTGLSIEINFSESSSTQQDHDSLTFNYVDVAGTSVSRAFTGGNFANFTIDASEFDISFTSDASTTDYGYSFTAQAIPCGSFVANQGATYTDLTRQTIESSHDYCDNLNVTQHYSFTNSGAAAISIFFDDSSSIETNYDSLTFTYVNSSGETIESVFTGSYFSDFVIDATEFDITFTSDFSVTYWGYRFDADPRPCASMYNSGNVEFSGTSVQTIESTHPYCDNMDLTQTYIFYDAPSTGLYITFDSSSSLEQGKDFLTISYTDSEGETISAAFTGTDWAAFIVEASQFTLTFTSDGSTTDYGYSITVDPSPCGAFSHDSGDVFDTMNAQVIESPHNYCDNLNVSQTYSWTDSAVASINLVFDDNCYVESYYDSFVISYTNTAGSSVSYSYSGYGFPSELTIDGTEFDLTFTSDYSVNYWGYKFTATPSTTASTGSVVMKSKDVQKKSASAHNGAMKMASVFKKWKNGVVKKSVKKSQQRIHN